LSENQPVLTKTPMGTVTRTSWEPGYYREVLRVEKTTRRAICAAPRKSDGQPCRSQPREKFGYYCNFHQGDTSDAQIQDLQPGDHPTAVSTNVGSMARSSQHVKQVLTKEFLHKSFPQCDRCPVRADCTVGMSESHCKFGEDIYWTMIDSIRTEYDVSQTDMYMIHRGVMAWVKSVYAEVIENEFSPTSDPAVIMRVASFKQAKEYREIMQKMGMTRGERKKSQSKFAELTIEADKAATSKSLAEMMGEYAKSAMQEKEYQPTKRKPKDMEVIESE
jgi:hypothetical protein